MKVLKALNGTELILDDHGNNLDSFRISLKAFMSFHKPVTGQELFFAVSYSKLALVYDSRNALPKMIRTYCDKDFFQ